MPESIHLPTRSASAKLPPDPQLSAARSLFRPSTGQPQCAVLKALAVCVLLIGVVFVITCLSLRSLPLLSLGGCLGAAVARRRSAPAVGRMITWDPNYQAPLSERGDLHDLLTNLPFTHHDHPPAALHRENRALEPYAQSSSAPPRGDRAFSALALTWAGATLLNTLAPSTATANAQPMERRSSTADSLKTLNPFFLPGEVQTSKGSCTITIPANGSDSAVCVPKRGQSPQTTEQQMGPVLPDRLGNELAVNQLGWKEMLDYLDERPPWRGQECGLEFFRDLLTAHRLMSRSEDFPPMRTYDVREGDQLDLKDRILRARPESDAEAIERIFDHLRPVPGGYAFKGLTSDEKLILDGSEILPILAEDILSYINAFKKNLCTGIAAGESPEGIACYLLLLVQKIKPWPEHSEPVARALANFFLKTENLSFFVPLDPVAYAEAMKAWDEMMDYMASCMREWHRIRELPSSPHPDAGHKTKGCLIGDDCPESSGRLSAKALAESMADEVLQTLPSEDRPGVPSSKRLRPEIYGAARSGAVEPLPSLAELRYFPLPGIMQTPSSSCALTAALKDNALAVCSQYSEELQAYILKGRHDLLALVGSSNRRFVTWKGLPILINPRLQLWYGWKAALEYLDGLAPWKGEGCPRDLLRAMFLTHMHMTRRLSPTPVRSSDILKGQQGLMRKKILRVSAAEDAGVISRIFAQKLRTTKTGDLAFRGLTEQEAALLEGSGVLPELAETVERNLATLAMRLCAAIDNDEDLRKQGAYFLHHFRAMKPWSEHSEQVGRLLINFLLKQSSDAFFVPLDAATYDEAMESGRAMEQYVRASLERWEELRRSVQPRFE